MFIERQFFAIRSGAVGGPRYRTTIKQLRGGGEHRNALWADPLRSFNFSLAARDTAAIQDVLDFAAETQGALHAFRVKDWSDYTMDNEQIATGDGTTFYFRITKGYGPTYRRRILKPVPGTVVVRVNGAVVSAYVDTTQGVVVPAVTPPSGSVIRVTCEFDVPCRLADDDVDILMLYHRKGQWDGIGIQEVRVTEVIDPLFYAAQQ